MERESIGKGDKGEGQKEEMEGGREDSRPRPPGRPSSVQKSLDDFASLCLGVEVKSGVVADIETWEAFLARCREEAKKYQQLQRREKKKPESGLDGGQSGASEGGVLQAAMDAAQALAAAAALPQAAPLGGGGDGEDNGEEVAEKGQSKSGGSSSVSSSSGGHLFAQRVDAPAPIAAATSPISWRWRDATRKANTIPLVRACSMLGKGEFTLACLLRLLPAPTVSADRPEADGAGGADDDDEAWSPAALREQVLLDAVRMGQQGVVQFMLHSQELPRFPPNVLGFAFSEACWHGGTHTAQLLLTLAPQCRWEAARFCMSERYHVRERQGHIRVMELAVESAVRGGHCDCAAFLARQEGSLALTRDEWTRVLRRALASTVHSSSWLGGAPPASAPSSAAAAKSVASIPIASSAQEQAIHAMCGAKPSLLAVVRGVGGWASFQASFGTTPHPSTLQRTVAFNFFSSHRDGLWPRTGKGQDPPRVYVKTSGN